MLTCATRVCIPCLTYAPIWKLCFRLVAINISCGNVEGIFIGFGSWGSETAKQRWRAEWGPFENLKDLILFCFMVFFFVFFVFVLIMWLVEIKAYSIIRFERVLFFLCKWGQVEVVESMWITRMVLWWRDFWFCEWG